MNRPFLLDVNVLIALFDSKHAFHNAAHVWFGQAKDHGWRTTAITENGLLRIVSHPTYPNGAVPMTELAERLEEFKQVTSTHEFWKDNVSPSAWINERRIALASTRLTDGYLLKLASENAGKLATFDLRIMASLIGSEDPTILEHIPF